MATGSKQSEFGEKRRTEKTDTEVGEDGMDAGERDMRSEFLFGDPREADGEVRKKMRAKTWRERKEIRTGEGRRVVGSRVGHRWRWWWWWWWFGDGVEANKGKGAPIDSYSSGHSVSHFHRTLEFRRSRKNSPTSAPVKQKMADEVERIVTSATPADISYLNHMTRRHPISRRSPSAPRSTHPSTCRRPCV